jgi:PAS domain S-box-containing protein
MKISSKLILIQLTFIVGLIIFVGVWELFSSYQTRIFLDSTKNHTKHSIEQVLSFSQQGFQQPLNDNSEWIETLNYLKNPNRNFELECFNTLLGTYSINYISIYRADGTRVYEVNDTSVSTLNHIMEELEVQKLLSVKNPKCHFFITKENRLFEVFGATVVPTTDVHHLSAPEGFLFFIKYWDDDYLSHLRVLTQSELIARTSAGELEKDKSYEDSYITKELQDWKGRLVAKIDFIKKDPFVAEWKERNLSSAFHSAILGLLIILVISYSFRRWISKPLISTIDELKYTEERFRQVAENAGEWIWEIDLHGRYTYSNAIVEKILGYTADELTKELQWYDLFPPDKQEALKDEALEILKHEKVIKDLVNPHLHKNGSEVTLQSSCSPFYDSEGKIIGYRGTALNVTDHKKAMEDLQAALNKAEENDRLKTAFLNNISHEIRTPMNAIIGYSDLLNGAINNHEKQKAYTEIISTATHQLLSIIDDIINISTLEAGQEVFRPQEVHLNSLLRNLREQFQLKASKKGLGLEMSTTLPDQQSIILTDETKLVQILSNLLINAFKFTKDGHIIFGYKVKSNRLEFFVKDTGIGIASELHEIIFDRFRQADSSIIREFGGTGLGLSISKAYVQLMGGKIWLESEPGKGSTFYFDIPLKPFNQQKEKPPLIHGIIESQFVRTILVAEDEELNFLLINEMFSQHNWKILKAVNGSEAVEICKQEPEIDLVLMDLKMPIMDGYTATEKIKSLRPTLPVIVQTAYINEEDRKKAFRYGCDDYITKPFNKALFTEILGRYVEY